MLSRALILATVTLLIGCLTAVGVLAVENLEAGKSPAQIFSGTCSACHKSPRGLLKSVAPSSLPGFLRQHYTTGTEMAGVLASYLISNGATDTRGQPKDQAKKDAKQDGTPDQLDRFGRRQQPAAEAARPDADGLKPQGEGRPGRDAKRLARPAPTPEANKPGDGEVPVQAATDSKHGAKQKLGKRAKPGEASPKTEEAARTSKDDPSSDAAKTESSKTETAKTDDAGKTDAAKTDTAKTDAKSEGDKPEAAKPSEEAVKPPAEGKSETAKVDAPKENAGSEPTPLRPDPVPPVTPASPSSSAAGGTPEPAASPSAAAPTATPIPPPAAVAATAPAPPPVAPAGPPAPPISR